MDFKADSFTIIVFLQTFSAIVKILTVFAKIVYLNICANQTSFLFCFAFSLIGITDQ